MMKFANTVLKGRPTSTSLLMRSAPFATQQRNFATLVLSEHFEGKLSPTLGSVLTAAAELNDGPVDVLVHGDGCDAQVEEVQKYPGINKIIVASDPALQNPYGDFMSKLTH